jgi:hypothetical protein
METYNLRLAGRDGPFRGRGPRRATEMAREFAYGLAKRAYGFQREPVGRT